jgi:SOS regulatory protein LexA
MIKIPLLGVIAAGEPIEAIRQNEFIAFPKSKLPSNGNLYALRVAGNSMMDENIKDGDIVLVKQQDIVENGERVVALIDNHEATLKKFYKERGYIRLQPANKTFEPIIIRKDRDIKIQGIVIDVIKNEEDLQAEEIIISKEIKK